MKSFFVWPILSWILYLSLTQSYYFIQNLAQHDFCMYDVSFNKKKFFLKKNKQMAPKINVFTVLNMGGLARGEYKYEHVRRKCYSRD